MQQPVHHQPHERPERPERPEKPRRKMGAFVRFVRGYLMLVGAGTTIYVLIQLLVRLFIEMEQWMGPGAPIS